MRNELTVGLRPAQEGYCSACGDHQGTIAHLGMGGITVRLCAACAKRLRRLLHDFAKATR